MFKRGGVLAVLLASMALSTTVVNAGTPPPSGSSSVGPGQAKYLINLSGSADGGSPPIYPSIPPAFCPGYWASTQALPIGTEFITHESPGGGSATYGVPEFTAEPPSGTQAANSTNSDYSGGRMPQGPGYWYYALWNVVGIVSGSGSNKTCTEQANFVRIYYEPITPSCSPNCGGNAPSQWNATLEAVAQWQPLAPCSAPDSSHIIVYNPTFLTAVVPYQVEGQSGALSNGVQGQKCDGYKIGSATSNGPVTVLVPERPLPVDNGCCGRYLHVVFVITLTPVETEWNITMSGANSGAGINCDLYTYGMYPSDGGYSSCPGITYQNGGFVFTTDATNLQIKYRVYVRPTAVAYWEIDDVGYSQHNYPTPAPIATAWSPTEVGSVQQIQGSGCSSSGCG